VTEPTATKPIHREGFSRPETLGERLGYATEKFLARLGIGILLIIAVLVLVIGIPLMKVARSDELAFARDLVERSEVVEHVVGPLESMGLPRRFKLDAGRATIAFPVRGIHGEAEVEVVVEEEKPYPDGRRAFRLVDGKVTDRRGRGFSLKLRRR
jgi:hypothetical protein